MDLQTNLQKEMDATTHQQLSELARSARKATGSELVILIVSKDMPEGSGGGTVTLASADFRNSPKSQAAAAAEMLGGMSRALLSTAKGCGLGLPAVVEFLTRMGNDKTMSEGSLNGEGKVEIDRSSDEVTH